eukprot:58226_1
MKPASIFVLLVLLCVATLTNAGTTEDVVPNGYRLTGWHIQPVHAENLEECAILCTGREDTDDSSKHPELCDKFVFAVSAENDKKNCNLYYNEKRSFFPESTPVEHEYHAE